MSFIMKCYADSCQPWMASNTHSNFFFFSIENAFPYSAQASRLELEKDLPTALPICRRYGRSKLGTNGGLRPTRPCLLGKRRGSGKPCMSWRKKYKIESVMNKHSSTICKLAKQISTSPRQFRRHLQQSRRRYRTLRRILRYVHTRKNQKPEMGSGMAGQTRWHHLRFKRIAATLPLLTTSHQMIIQMLTGSI